MCVRESNRLGELLLAVSPAFAVKLSRLTSYFVIFPPASCSFPGDFPDSECGPALRCTTFCNAQIHLLLFLPHISKPDIMESKRPEIFASTLITYVAALTAMVLRLFARKLTKLPYSVGDYLA